MKYGYAVVLEKGMKVPIYSRASLRGFRTDIIIWEVMPPEDVRVAALTSLQYNGGGSEYYGISVNDLREIKSRLI